VDLLVGGPDFQIPDVYHQVRRGGDEGNEEVVPEVHLREDRRKLAQLVRVPKGKS